MEPEFWREKWETNDIRFHESKTNPLLVRNLAALQLPPGAHIFVPLCGKSLDMHYLLTLGYRVTGAELSHLAVQQLFAEAGLAPQVEALGRVERYQAGPLTVYAGDFFDLDGATLGAVDAIYDRAALVALPPPMRDRYVARLLETTCATPQLLACFEYVAGLLEPPPHSIDEAEVRRRYSDAYKVTLLERYQLPEGLRGRHPVYEGVYLLQRLENHSVE